MKSFESRPTLRVKTCLAFLQVLSLIPLSLSHTNITITIFIQSQLVTFIFYIFCNKEKAELLSILSFYPGISNIGGCVGQGQQITSRNPKICKLFHLKIFDFSLPDQKLLFPPLGGSGFQNCQPKNDRVCAEEIGRFSVSLPLMQD